MFLAGAAAATANSGHKKFARRRAFSKSGILNARSLLALNDGVGGGPTE
jgi:hypothetical protein